VFCGFNVNDKWFETLLLRNKKESHHLRVAVKHKKTLVEVLKNYTDISKLKQAFNEMGSRHEMCNV